MYVSISYFESWSNIFNTLKHNFFNIWKINFFDSIHFHSILFWKRFNDFVIFSKFLIHLRVNKIVFIKLRTFVEFWNFDQFLMMSIIFCLILKTSFILCICFNVLIWIISIFNFFKKIFIWNQKIRKKKWFFKK